MMTIPGAAAGRRKSPVGSPAEFSWGFKMTFEAEWVGDSSAGSLLAGEMPQIEAGD